MSAALKSINESPYGESTHHVFQGATSDLLHLLTTYGYWAVLFFVAIERVFLFFHLQRPPLCGWSAIVAQVALTYTATIVVALAAQQAGRPDLIRSPKRVLAYCWEALDG